MTVQSILLRESNSSPKKKERKKNKLKGHRRPVQWNKLEKQNKTKQEKNKGLSFITPNFLLAKKRNKSDYGEFSGPSHWVLSFSFFSFSSYHWRPLATGHWPKRLEGEEPKSKTTPRQREEEVGTGPPGICWFVDCTVYLCVCVCASVFSLSSTLPYTHTHIHIHIFIYLIS